MGDADIAASYIPSLYKPASLLPIARHRQSLLYLVDTYPVTIVVGQTGSGKTTQIPQYLDQAGWTAEGKVVAVTQVGYSIRFEDVTSSATRIKFVTDGLLLREALVDPLLSRYAVIMVDEAHERSLSTDILLGILKKIRKKRPELRIVVSSATLQAEDVLRFFAGEETVDEKGPNKGLGGSIGRIISLEGRMYPVDLYYLEKPTADYVERAVETVFEIHAKEGEGDVLLFLTGREEIDRAIDLISDRAQGLHARAASVSALPLYAGLTTEQQLYVFEPAAEKTRKVIVSTNIAEASVTIDGIAYVIDCGFVKLRAFNPATNIETLTATAISKASATQRAGRAGRTKAGKCYRLYTEAAYHDLPAASIPEIQRSNLAPVILQLKALGIDNIARFDFLTSPPAQLVIRALELLYSLGALDEYAKLTKPLGLRMAELAVEPMMAKCLLQAPQFGCVGEMLTIAAMTSLQGAVWYQHEGGKKAQESGRRKFAAAEGDHLTLLNVYQAFVTKSKKDEARWCRDHSLNYQSMARAVSVRGQLKRYLDRFGIDVGGGGGGGGGPSARPSAGSSSAPSTTQAGSDQGELIRRCLTTGFFAHAARMQPDGSYRPVHSDSTVLYAHPSSLMFNRKADWVIFHEVIETGKGQKTFIREITTIEKAWLLEYAPEYYQVRA
ncbi:MAG: hypothetical protein M1826_002810 [Phylliscum demangeonii]|nr:MAG: hypothetical protein M1826_002810 [Phylliscum demangeonii]